MTYNSSFFVTITLNCCHNYTKYLFSHVQSRWQVWKGILQCIVWLYANSVNGLLSTLALNAEKAAGQEYYAA